MKYFFSFAQCCLPVLIAAGAMASIPTGELVLKGKIQKFIFPTTEKSGIAFNRFYESEIPETAIQWNDLEVEHKKWLAVLLAFPLPLGIVGAHRIYLGTKPLVPVVYIVTLGGAAGILPFIDFMVLLLADDITLYENNPDIIMWMKD